MYFPNDYFAERERWNTQISENSARGATAWGSVHTDGWGEFVLPDAIMFGVTFTEQPAVSYGWAMEDDDQLVEGRYPRCSGGVLRWVRTSGDFYIGAHVLITVATADPLLAAQAWATASRDWYTALPSNEEAHPFEDPPDYAEDPGYDLTHSFTFSAMAIKEIGG